jgi:hypothetical protein
VRIIHHEPCLTNGSTYTPPCTCGTTAYGQSQCRAHPGSDAPGEPHKTQMLGTAMCGCEQGGGAASKQAWRRFVAGLFNHCQKLSLGHYSKMELESPLRASMLLRQIWRARSYQVHHPPHSACFPAVRCTSADTQAPSSCARWMAPAATRRPFNTRLVNHRQLAPPPARAASVCTKFACYVTSVGGYGYGLGFRV